MTQAVVERLEAIEIDQDDRTRAKLTVIGSHCMFETVAKEGAIGESGQRIVERLMRDGGC
jgi:hypothetical protein